MIEGLEGLRVKPTPTKSILIIVWFHMRAFIIIVYHKKTAIEDSHQHMEYVENAKNSPSLKAKWIIKFI